MTFASGTWPEFNISVVRSITVFDTKPSNPTCPGTPHLVHPGNVSSQSTPSWYNVRNIASELHATVNICTSNFFRFWGIGSSGDKQQSSMIYRKICRTKTRESEERLYNSIRIGNGSSQELSHVRFNMATKRSASLAIKYVGGVVLPSN